MSLDDLISHLEDIRDEYDFGDQPVLVEDDRGEVAGGVTGIDLNDERGVWLIFEREDDEPVERPEFDAIGKG